MMEVFSPKYIPKTTRLRVSDESDSRLSFTGPRYLAWCHGVMRKDSGRELLFPDLAMKDKNSDSGSVEKRRTF
jgi:hypothetical protein